jgi:hypothetical protein
MTDKPKRKNDQPIPRCYWWIFGILAIVLLIGLRFPVRLWASYEVNFLLYVLIAVACSLATIQFIKRFRWRHKIVIVLLTCFVLTGLNIRNMYDVYIPIYEPTCTIENFGMMSVHDCIQQAGCFVSTAQYVGVRGMPIVVRTSEYWNGYCMLF